MNSQRQTSSSQEPVPDIRSVHRSGSRGKVHFRFDQDPSAISNSHGAAQYQLRARYTRVGGSSDTAMADALLQPADDDSDEGGARASPHFTNLRQSSKKMECLNVSNEERVKEFLLGRIRKLHQMSNKEVAKAWIRGICPKKQTHFPYRNHDREAQGVPPQVPGWWPPTAPSRGIDLSNISSCASHADEHYRALGLKYCSFVEPDHMKKHGESTPVPALHSLLLT